MYKRQSLILLLAEMGVMVNIGRNGERARLEREEAHAERERPRKAKPIVLDTARRAQTAQYGGTKMRVLIAAGGTAGHINPALAIAEMCIRDRGASGS